MGAAAVDFLSIRPAGWAFALVDCRPRSRCRSYRGRQMGASQLAALRDTLLQLKRAAPAGWC